ncbi:MAG: PLP-dependent aspartate aminotransferase family protein [Bryobacteraceae bacterium]|nr:PLP-dependent aspartate aminotransferase family protein [Bryobacteraceae bacterium]
MNIQTKAVHAGDRKKPGPQTPSTTPIHLASTYFYDTTEHLDKVFGQEIEGESYSRYSNPTNTALEELVASLENAPGALACSSGMMALQVALMAALLDRRKSVLAANALYGASIKLLTQVFGAFGVEVRFVDICDLNAVRSAAEEEKPGCIFMETISNPLLRVGNIEEVAKIARAHGAALVVDNTFATPLMVHPIALGAHISVHSLTKYLAGHGDVLGGAVICDEEHLPVVRQLCKTLGPNLGPVEAYLAMRGIKTFPMRMERQCRNASRLASWLVTHPKVDRVYFPGDPAHPDSATVSRMFPKDLFGAIVSFELKGLTEQQQVFEFMDRLKLIVRGTSLGDVHSLLLYPAMASHRDLGFKQRLRLGIKENLVRVSVGIEAVEDIIADLEQAL